MKSSSKMFFKQRRSVQLNISFEHELIAQSLERMHTKAQQNSEPLPNGCRLKSLIIY